MQCIDRSLPPLTGERHLNKYVYTGAAPWAALRSAIACADSRSGLLSDAMIKAMSSRLSAGRCDRYNAIRRPAAASSIRMARMTRSRHMASSPVSLVQNGSSGFAYGTLSVSFEPHIIGTAADSGDAVGSNGCVVTGRPTFTG